MWKSTLNLIWLSFRKKQTLTAQLKHYRLLWAITWEPLVFILDGVSCVRIPFDQSHFRNADSSGYLTHKDKRSEATGFGFTVTPRFMAPLHNRGLHIIWSPADPRPNMWHKQAQRGDGCITCKILKMYTFFHNSHQSQDLLLERWTHKDTTEKKISV